MKRVFGIVIIGVFLLSISGLVSAGPLEDVKNFANNVLVEVLKPLAELVVGNYDLSPELFFAKVLFAIVVFSIIWKSLQKIPFFNETAWVLVLVSVSASLLAIRWIDKSDIISTMLLPYSALGVALTAGIPFVLYFLIVEGMGSNLGRKAGWSFFIVIFISLWYIRADEVKNFAYIYLATAGLAFLALSFDGTIQNVLKKSRVERTQALYGSRMALELKKIMKQKQDDYANDPNGYESYYDPNKKGKNGYTYDMDKIKDLIAHLKS